MHQFNEEIPANLSLRVKKKVTNLETQWIPIVTVLDYDIIDAPNDGLLLKFD